MGSILRGFNPTVTIKIISKLILRRIIILKFKMIRQLIISCKYFLLKEEKLLNLFHKLGNWALMVQSVIEVKLPYEFPVEIPKFGPKTRKSGVVIQRVNFDI